MMVVPVTVSQCAPCYKILLCVNVFSKLGIESESARNQSDYRWFFYGGRTKRVFLGARTKVNFLSNIFDIGRLRFGIICDEYVLFETKPRERKRNNKGTQSRTEILIYIKCVYLRDLKVEDKYSIILTEDFIKSVIYLTDVK